MRRVVFLARPTPEHTAYWDTQIGYLSVFLIADDPETAEATANEIVARLPYELIGIPRIERVVFAYGGAPTLPVPAPESPSCDLLPFIKEALQAGSAICFIAWPTGMDESGFLAAFSENRERNDKAGLGGEGEDWKK